MSTRHDGVPAFFKDNPEIELPMPGARGWLLQGESQQMVCVEFSETVEVPEHQHASQWEFALAGRMELRRDGHIELVEAGDNFYVPEGQLHGATVYAGYRAIIVFDEPHRYTVKQG